METNQTFRGFTHRAAAAPPVRLRADQRSPAEHGSPRGSSPTHARAVARAVTPLVAHTLALRARLETCRTLGPPTSTAPALPLGVFADQLLASAQLLAACVREVSGDARTRREDAAASGGVRQTGAGHDVWVDALRRLLADEERLARRLRRAVDTCDAHADDRTADCVEEVLDEIRRQHATLAHFLANAPESRSYGSPSPRAAARHAEREA